jgi:hypothetical protein
MTPKRTKSIFSQLPFFKGGKVESSTADHPKAPLPLKKGGREGFLGKPFQNTKVLPPIYFDKFPFGPSNHHMIKDFRSV